MQAAERPAAGKKRARKAVGGRAGVEKTLLLSARRLLLLLASRSAHWHSPFCCLGERTLLVGRLSSLACSLFRSRPALIKASRHGIRR
jgi:hypothetical protein